MSKKLKVMWKGAVVAYLSQYPAVSGGTEEIHDKSIGRYARRDSNRLSPEQR
jgi:hypothetical protein